MVIGGPEVEIGTSPRTLDPISMPRRFKIMFMALFMLFWSAWLR
jgi:hypothetical protein